MVLSWLLKEIAESVLYSQSAKDLWSDLEDRFGQANGAKLFQLQKELSSVMQGNSSVSTYFTKMKSLWDELDALNTFSSCVCECECGAKVKSLKAHQDERLLQFLMGLNDIFIGVRSNNLLSSPLPSIGHAYSLVIQDEKQREIHATPAYSGESASFIATSQPGNFRKLNENRIQKTTDFKFTREKRFQGSAQANKASFSNEENEQGAENTSGVQNLIKENVAELLQLLQQVKVGQNSAGTSDVAANVSYADLKTLAKPLMVKLSNSYKVQVTHSRTVPLLPNLILRNGPSVKSPLEIGKQEGGLYILRSSSPKFRSVFIPRRNSVSNHGLRTCFSFSDSIVKEKVWHYRLGHMPFSNMKNVSSVSISKSSKFFTPCVICPMARQSKLPFPSSSISTKKVFELIHVDIWGPYNSATYDGFRYFLTIVDDFSRGTWTYLLTNKSNAFTILKGFLAMVERQFNSKVKTIRSDNAFELGSGKV
uniref:Uncharacterized protein LOC104224521 n=1 Tax=Nicotiana sylvestris TaxID=4096 RepID=A0A1U7W7B5_NICSY|nr:PREDICTED: uncharacterized protein LOC104224521 [Nicotiana sylvestris]